MLLSEFWGQRKLIIPQWMSHINMRPPLCHQDMKYVGRSSSLNLIYSKPGEKRPGTNLNWVFYGIMEIRNGKSKGKSLWRCRFMCSAAPWQNNSNLHMNFSCRSVWAVRTVATESRPERRSSVRKHQVWFMKRYRALHHQLLQRCRCTFTERDALRRTALFADLGYADMHDMTWPEVDMENINNLTMIKGINCNLLLNTFNKYILNYNIWTCI